MTHDPFIPRRNEFGQPIGAALHGWTPPPRPPRAPMQGRYARLAPLSAADHAAALHRAFAADDGRMWTYMGYGPFADEAALYAHAANLQASEDPLFFTILDARDDAPLGVASYLRIEPQAGSIEVGHIALSPAAQRTRIATEAMYLMMARAFSELGYRRYEWKCDALNAPSRRAAARLGFTFEGVFRQALVYKGRNRDTAWFSITDAEWPARRDAFEAWLDPANFDAEGRQRRPLAAFAPPADPASGDPASGDRGSTPPATAGA